MSKPMSPAEAEMNQISAATMRAVAMPDRTLPTDWACCAGFIGIINTLRLNGLDENVVFREAQKVCPKVN